MASTNIRKAERAVIVAAQTVVRGLDEILETNSLTGLLEQAETMTSLVESVRALNELETP